MIKVVYGNRYLAHAFILLILVMALYSNSLDGDFIWDDRGLILGAEDFLSEWKNICNAFVLPCFGNTAYYRPFLNVSLILDYQLWGMNPFGYHVTNLLLHMINALLVYVFILGLLKQAELALLAGLLFIVHPVQSEAVAWISGRNDLLLTCFALISCIAYVHWVRYENWQRKGIYVACLIFYAAALCSKESAVVLPLLFALIDAFYPDPRRPLLREYAGIALITALYGILRLFVLGGMGIQNGETGWTGSVWHILMTYAYYFRVLILPLCVSTLPEINPEHTSNLICSCALMMLLALIIWICRKRGKEISFALLWVIVALIPVCGVAPLFPPALDHRLYLGTVCFCMVIPCVMQRFLQCSSIPGLAYKASVIALFIVPAIIIGCAVKTMERNCVWQHERTFWQQATQDAPHSPLARNGLGLAYAQGGDYVSAAREFRHAIKLCDEQKPISTSCSMVAAGKLYNNLGQAYYQILTQKLQHAKREGPVDEGGKKSREAMKGEIQRLYAMSHTCYRLAIRHDSKSAVVHNNMGDLYALMNNLGAAIAAYQKAAALDNECPLYHRNLGLTSYLLKRYPEAEKALQRAIALQPNNVEARNNLALVYFQRGLYAKAAAQLKTVLSDKTNNPEIYFNLAMVYLLGFCDREMAIRYVKQGLRIAGWEKNTAMIETVMQMVTQDIPIECESTQISPSVEGL